MFAKVLLYVALGAGLLFASTQSKATTTNAAQGQTQIHTSMIGGGDPEPLCGPSECK